VNVINDADIDPKLCDTRMGWYHVATIPYNSRISCYFGAIHVEASRVAVEGIRLIYNGDYRFSLFVKKTNDVLITTLLDDIVC
jgi:hypothetical protein